MLLSLSLSLATRESIDTLDLLFLRFTFLIFYIVWLFSSIFFVCNNFFKMLFTWYVVCTIWHNIMYWYCNTILSKHTVCYIKCCSI